MKLWYGLGLGLALCSAVSAKVAPDQVARLGKDLTPMGAERAASKDGSIPEWTGGLALQAGDNPFANEKPLFTITAANMATYQQRLTPGLQAMLSAYPSFSIPVYPTHRTARLPEQVYQANKRNAEQAELVDNGNGIVGAATGVAFPIPNSALEVLWNHITRFRAEKIKRVQAQAALTRDGDYTLIRLEEEVDLLYSKFDADPAKVVADNLLFYFKQAITEPARLAGSVLLLHETLNQVKQPRDAWVYNTGQRRVRKAPNVSYDAPGTAADGLRTTDNFDMFNGAPDRYDWKLLGKQELYVPYNAYALASKSVKYADILKPLHINPALTRYELHRVWVLEANLKPGVRNIYKKRVMFIDEDSWQILLVDHYDEQGKLWRIGQAYGIQYLDRASFWTAAEAFYDLQSGRYLAMSLSNEEKPRDYDFPSSAADYTPQALRRDGVR